MLHQIIFYSYHSRPYFPQFSSFIYLNLINLKYNYQLLINSPFVIFIYLPMSNSQAKKQRALLKQQDPFSSRPMEKSTPLRSKSKVQYIDQMAKSFYSKGFTEEKQSTLMHSTHSFTTSKAFKNQEFVLKKHQNKKFDKLVSLVGYAINSADKALKFLNISCNFQAQFACKLFYSDRQTLMKEFNNFSLQECLSDKGMNSSSNSSEIKIIPFDQSILLAESKQLKHENQQLKKELMVIEGQLGKERKSDIWQSKSNHSFFSQHQPNQFKNLLMNKSCEEELLKTEFDFVERQHRRLENLLIKICKNSEINDFLELIKKESKYKLESLNSEHSFGERNSFDNLSIISEKKIEALEEKIISEIETIRLKASQHEVTLKECNKLKQTIQVIAKILEINLHLQADMVSLAQKECKSFIKKRQKQMMLVQAEFENQLTKSIQKIQKISSEKETQFQTIMEQKDMSLDTLLAEKQQLQQELQDTQRTNNELMDQARQMYQQLKEYKLVKTKEQQQLLRENNSLKDEIKRLKEQSAFDIKNSENILQINQQLQRACYEKQQKLQKEKQQHLRLNSEIQLKKRFIIKKDKELQRKNTVIQQLQYKYGLIASSSKQVGQKMQILQAEKDRLQFQLQQKANMLKVANEQSLILANKIQVYEKQNSIFKKSFLQEKAHLYQGKDNQIRALEEENQKLQNKLDAQQSRIQGQQSQLIQQINSQRSKNTGKDEKIQQLQLKVQSLIISNKALKDQLQKQTTSLRKELIEQSTKQSFLHAQNQELQRLLKDNRQKSKESITALQQLMEHLKEENQQTKNKNNELKVTVNLLREQAKVKEENQMNKISEMKKEALQREGFLLNQLTQMKQKKEKVLSDFQSQRQNQVNSHRKEAETHISSIQKLMKELQEAKSQLIQSKRCLSLRQLELYKLNTLIDDQKSRYEVELLRKEEQLSQCKERLNKIEINLNSKIQQTRELKDRLQSENERLKLQIVIKETEINQKANEIQNLLTQKQHLIKQKQYHQSQLIRQIKSQTELIQELTTAKIALQTELKDRQAADGIMEDLANPSAFSQHVSIISKQDQNNFQDFSEYIGRKMQESFISIINSQAMQSFSQCKAKDILQRQATSKIKKSNQSEDQFEDFSSSHPRTEDIMLSMDSYHDPQQLMEHSVTFKHQSSSKDNILKLGDQQIPKILHENSLGLGYLQTNQEDGAPLQFSLQNNQHIQTQKSQDQNWLSTSLTMGLFSNAELAGQNAKDRKRIKRTPKKYSLFKEESDK